MKLSVSAVFSTALLLTTAGVYAANVDITFFYTASHCNGTSAFSCRGIPAHTCCHNVDLELALSTLYQHLPLFAIQKAFLGRCTGKPVATIAGDGCSSTKAMSAYWEDKPPPGQRRGLAGRDAAADVPCKGTQRVNRATIAGMEFEVTEDNEAEFVALVRREVNEVPEHLMAYRV